MKVVHVISGLGVGGAETMLYRLLAATADTLESEVVTLIAPGPMASDIESLGVPIRSLDLDPRFPNPLRLRQLVRWLEEADVVQTWMYHSDLVGGLAARVAGSGPVVWGIRRGTIDASLYKHRTVLTARACAALSGHVPTRIVSNSHKGVDTHVEFGYAREKMEVIPNGFDLEAFRPRPEAGRRVREDLGIPSDVPLVGMIARFHPQKDHGNFVAAAGRLHATRPEVHYVLCGRDVDPDNDELVESIEKEGIADRCHLLGLRDDVPAITSALDVATLSSRDEGFPNVVGEAMACGVPCVVTDVGDAARLVGDTGVTVPPADPNALAEGWHEVLALDAEARDDLGRRARDRIRERYSITRVAEQFERLYEELAPGESQR